MDVVNRTKNFVVEKIVNVTCHILFGLGTVLIYPFYPGLSLLGVGLFLLYEFLQWVVKDDVPTHEIREFSMGFFFGIVLIVILSFVGILVL